MDTLYAEFIRFLFAVLTLAVTTLLPVLLAYAIGRIRNDQYRAYAETLVRYAQQRIPAASERYDYAAARLAARFPSLNEAAIRELIEATVHAVKTAPVTPSDAPPSAPAPLRLIVSDEAAGGEEDAAAA